jgi:hypothetical protein
MQGRAVADQIMKDLRAHNGRASDLRQLMTGGGSTAETIDPAFRSLASTQLMQQEKQDAANFFRNTDPTGVNRAFGNADRQMRDIGANNPALGWLLNKSDTAKGALDALNISSPVLASRLSYSVTDNQRAEANTMANMKLTDWFNPGEVHNQTARELERITTGAAHDVTKEAKGASAPSGTVSLSPQTIQQLGQVISTLRIGVSPEDAAHAATVASTGHTDAPGPAGRRR